MVMLIAWGSLFNKGKRHFIYDNNKYKIKQLRNKCGNRCSLYCHTGKSKFSKYQQIVQSCVYNNCSKACQKWYRGIFLTAQP